MGEPIRQKAKWVPSVGSCMKRSRWTSSDLKNIPSVGPLTTPYVGSYMLAGRKLYRPSRLGASVSYLLFYDWRGADVYDVCCFGVKQTECRNCGRVDRICIETVAENVVQQSLG